MTCSVAVYSMKGGVGKSTLAANIAHCSATCSGYRTLLWDLDAQGAAAFLLGQDQGPGKASRVFSREVEPARLVEPTRWPGLDLLAADLSLRHLDRTLAEAEKPKRLRKLLRTLGPAYDRIILDCPPGLGEISDQIFRAVDLIVVPVQPTPFAQRSLSLVRDYLAKELGGKPPLLPVFSMVDRRKRLHRELLEENPGWPAVPHASVIERMAIEHAPVTDFARTSPAAKAMTELWRRVEDALGAPPKP